MHGWDLAALLIGVFWLGGYLALLGRAMLDASRLRREGRDVVRQAEQTLNLDEATPIVVSGGLIGPVVEPDFRPFDLGIVRDPASPEMYEPPRSSA